MKLYIVVIDVPIQFGCTKVHWLLLTIYVFLGTLRSFQFTFLLPDLES